MIKGSKDSISKIVFCTKASSQSLWISGGKLWTTNGEGNVHLGKFAIDHLIPNYRPWKERSSRFHQQKVED